MPTILKIAVPAPLPGTFDYLPPPKNEIPLQPGQRVKIPWRNKTCIGVLLEIVQHSKINVEKLKHADCILDTVPILNNKMLQFVNAAANYYHHPIGEVLEHCLPTVLRNEKKPKEIIQYNYSDWIIKPTAFTANSWQQSAIETINATKNFQTYLLDGITGSGKTEVYLQIIAEKLQAHKQALVLVPEISLTPQTFARFANRFDAPIFMIHSGLTEKEKYLAWTYAKQGHAAIIIGTRSAVFTMFCNLGIIVIDEEHDLSFKQQSGFRYSSRDLAILRGQIENVPVVLGSATPSLETLHNTQQAKYQYLNLPQRVNQNELPKFQIIDIHNQKTKEGLSEALIEKIKQHLDAEQQVLLFLNRRGFAPVILCHRCRWIAKCHRCDAKMTLHNQPKKLICHHCDSQAKIPVTCQNCFSHDLIYLGMGTERLEETLHEIFPDIEIIRIDRDTVRKKGILQKKIEMIQQGKKQILLGTQMLTKGHHFPNLSLVAIISADYYLFSTDFRASERMGQLITQVAGRAGREKVSGEVLIQTHFPEHISLQQLIFHGYSDFAKNLLKERMHSDLPPHTYLTLIRAEALKKHRPLDFLKFVLQNIQKEKMEDIQVYGPVPSTMEKKAGYFRAQLFIFAKKRNLLQKRLQQLIPILKKSRQNRNVRWSVDVDPQEIG